MPPSGFVNARGPGRGICRRPTCGVSEVGALKTIRAVELPPALDRRVKRHSASSLPDTYDKVQHLARNARPWLPIGLPTDRATACFRSGPPRGCDRRVRRVGATRRRRHRGQARMRSPPQEPAARTVRRPRRGSEVDGPQFKHDRDTRDTFVQRDSPRFRHALQGLGALTTSRELQGFDLLLPKSSFVRAWQGARMPGVLCRASTRVVARHGRRPQVGTRRGGCVVFLIDRGWRRPGLASSIAASAKRPAAPSDVLPVDARTGCTLPHTAGDANTCDRITSGP